MPRGFNSSNQRPIIRSVNRSTTIGVSFFSLQTRPISHRIKGLILNLFRHEALVLSFKLMVNVLRVKQHFNPSHLGKSI